MQQNLFKMIITGFLFTGILAFGVRNVDAAPIQWTVSSGGNGHFYDVVATPLSWSDAKVGAEALT